MYNSFSNWCLLSGVFHKYLLNFLNKLFILDIYFTIDYMKHYLLIILPLIFLISSCYYDSEEELYPQVRNCDTTNIYYFHRNR